MELGRAEGSCKVGDADRPRDSIAGHVADITASTPKLSLLGQRGEPRKTR